MFRRNHDEDYKNIEQLGRGAFGKVKKVERLNDGKIFACKIVDLTKDAIKKDEGELEYLILSRLKHPYVVGYIDYRQETQKVRLYMEYCPGGDCLNLIKQAYSNRLAISERKIWTVIFQLASALIYCHYGVHTTADGQLAPFSRLDEWDPILHRDIKPANVMICQNDEDTIKVKLGDFGLSRIIDSEKALSTMTGTLNYKPPEIDINNPSGIKWTKKCDIFSLGCTLHHLCYLKTPQEAQKPLDPSKFEVPEDTYSKRLTNCIKSCMSSSSEDRPDAFDLLRQVQRARHDPQTQHLVPPMSLSLDDSLAAAIRRFTRVIRCPYCTLEYSGNTTADASNQVQEHFRKSHREMHGTHQCRLATCRYSGGPGFYCSHELLRHYETDHPGRRLPSPRPPIFCPSPDCFWGLGLFEGFATEEAEERHYQVTHQDKKFIPNLTDQLKFSSFFACPFSNCLFRKRVSLFDRPKTEFKHAKELRDHINQSHIGLSQKVPGRSLWDIPGPTTSDSPTPHPFGTLRPTKSAEDQSQEYSTTSAGFRGFSSSNTLGNQTHGAIFGNTKSGDLGQPSNTTGGGLFGNSRGSDQPSNKPGILFGGSNEPRSNDSKSVFGANNTSGGLFGQSRETGQSSNEPGILFGGSNKSRSNDSEYVYGQPSKKSGGIWGNLDNHSLGLGQIINTTGGNTSRGISGDSNSGLVQSSKTTGADNSWLKISSPENLFPKTTKE